MAYFFFYLFMEKNHKSNFNLKTNFEKKVFNKNYPEISSLDFGSDFLWGAACASYQVEGSVEY